VARGSRNKSITPLTYDWIAFDLAGLLVEQRRFEEAEPFALRVLAIRDSINGPADADTRESLTQLATLYERWGRPERAAEYRQRMQRAKSGGRKVTAPLGTSRITTSLIGCRVARGLSGRTAETSGGRPGLARQATAGTARSRG